MSDVLSGTVPETGEIKGTISAKGTMSGGIATVFGKDGKSAYEVAVKNGFEGTEEEWLKSLKGDKGETGADVESVTESTEDGGSNVVTFRDGKTLTVKNGTKGSKGDKGTSATHSWNGTTLTITSESGTSSANLKGEKGDTGKSGVYIGSGYMPEDCNVQIDPDGQPISGVVGIDTSLQNSSSLGGFGELEEGKVYFVALNENTPYPFTRANVISVHANDYSGRQIQFAFAMDGLYSRISIPTDFGTTMFSEWRAVEGSQASITVTDDGNGNVTIK